MDTVEAVAMGRASRGATVKVFDWDKAAQIIAECGAQEASAGLSGDWEWTGGEIFADGKPVPAEDTYVYLASTWATPELLVTGTPDGDVTVPCWRYKQSDGDWDAKTYWPESALSILRK